jgi:hypothetical protein
MFGIHIHTVCLVFECFWLLGIRISDVNCYYAMMLLEYLTPTRILGHTACTAATVKKSTSTA